MADAAIGMILHINYFSPSPTKKYSLFIQLFNVMFYVYYLASINHPIKTYVGFTHDVEQRLQAHNSGKSTYTNQFKPWKILAYFAFDQESQARSFELYLKTNAGKVFLKRYCA